MSTNHSYYYKIKNLFTKLENKLNNLQVNGNRKAKRSIAWLGSAWKWIAGSPDEHDLQIITDKMNELLTNNNKQVIINKKIVEKFNDIIQHFNEVKSTPIDLYMEILRLEREIDNIIFTIHWAKKNIINPQVLDQEEIKAILDQIRKNQLPYNTVEDALNYATTKLASDDNNNLIYIISIPITNPETFDLLEVRANNAIKTTVKVPHNPVIFNQQQMYSFKRLPNEVCQELPNIKICRKNDLKDITQDGCLTNIIFEKKHSCQHVNNLHTTENEEIVEGVILLNNFRGQLNTTCDNYNQELNGSYVIKFNNCSINANGEIYHSKVKSFAIPHAHRFIEENLKEILSTKELQKLHINNTEEIAKLQSTSNRTWLSINILLASVAAILLYPKAKSLITSSSSNRDVSNLSGEELREQVATTSNSAFSIFPIT
jgi:hypothetical protein